MLLAWRPHSEISTVAEAGSQGAEWPTIGKLLESTSGQPVKSKGGAGRGSQYLQTEDKGSTSTLPSLQLSNRSPEVL